MNYHGEYNAAVCHICNYKINHPTKCKKCNSPRIKYLGLGTQRVVQELQELFPGVNTLRWDRDAASSKDSHEGMMNTFLKGNAQILVGTQMIAKGLHFPGVTLVGVLCADIGLFLPDFRAGERVFELLCQVSGRTGRSDLGGKVIIQTYSPTNYAVISAAAQDYEMFYSQEIAYRYELGLPPFSKLIRLIYSHNTEDTCVKQALYLGKKFRNQLEVMGITDVSVLGPSPAFPSKIRGKYRWHIILKGIDPRRLIDEINLPLGWTVEVDPISVT
jgi:primosomal protein N' (replication factor Y)